MRTTQSVSQDKTRVQIDFSPVEMLRLNWLMEVCDLGSRKDLFNNALTLLEWAALEIVQKRTIASFDDESKSRFILSMPALSAAARHQSQTDNSTARKFAEVAAYGD